MITRSSRSTVHYRLTAALEALPQKGDILHACGLTNWHMIVQEMVHVAPLQEDGTITLEMIVDRWDIGPGEGLCTLCGMAWFGDVPQPS